MAKHWVMSGMALVVSLAAAGTWGCGSSDSGSNLTCGAGTYNSGGVCVPIPWSADGGGGSGGTAGSGGSGGGAPVTCGAGTHLSNGECLPDPADAGVSCGNGTHEEDGSCVVDDGGAAVPGQVGDPCTAAADCTTKFCATPALNSRLVGGYCTKLGCSDTNACPSGSVCVDPGTGIRNCFRYCEPGSTGTCRTAEGYVCQPLSEDPQAGICAPGCATDADCPAGGVCDATSHICTTPPTCNPAAPSCGTGKTCLPTAQSPTGGFCFPDCTAAADCKKSEVCQPFAPGSTDGVCTPPGCTTNADCPAGATCAVQHDNLNFCQPPATCTDSCANADETCVGGLCLSSCAAGSTGDDACKAIHPDLLCADTFGACMPACSSSGDCSAGNSCFTTDDVCLPTGSFPGGPCKPNNTCDPVGSLPQSCVSGTCAVDCNDTTAQTGDGLCAAVNAALTCMPTNPSTGAGSCVYACGSGGACPAGYSCLEPTGTKTGAQNACLPNGSFPGSACATGDACGSYAGNAMTCSDGTCVLTCNAEADCTPLGLTCVESAHVCVQPCTAGACADNRYSCLTSENACLPTGSFPGSPCKTGNVCDAVNGLTQSCIGGQCVVDCNDKSLDTGDARCEVVNPGLTCMPTNPSTGDGSCVYACAGGLCPAGYSCFEPDGTMTGAQNACLPNGSFPGGACATGSACGSYGGKAMTCENNQCVLKCTADSECTPLGLTCVESAGVCVQPCGTNSTCEDNRYACLTSENACLPKGSFPGGPCNASNACSNYGSLPMACTSGTCLVSCNDSTVTDAVCQQVSSALTCDSTFTHACMPACVNNSCSFMPGYSCAAIQNACLPTGSFPGSPCRTTDPKCDENLGGNPNLDLVCVSNTCRLDCSWSSAICTGGTTCTAVPGTGGSVCM